MKTKWIVETTYYFEAENLEEVTSFINGVMKYPGKYPKVKIKAVEEKEEKK